MKRLLLTGLILLLSACGTPASSTPSATPVAINITFPSALKPWADKLTSCSSALPAIALYFSQTPPSDASIFSDHVSLILGEPSADDSKDHVSQVGWEQVVVIVNQDNPVAGLSTDELASIFSGGTTVWGGSSGKQIRVWVPPFEDPIRMIFDRAIIPSTPLVTEAWLAPDPNAMLEAVAKDPNAIGYLPGSILSSGDEALTSKVKILQLEPSLQKALHQPVLAITRDEPQGLLRELLVCLQNGLP